MGLYNARCANEGDARKDELPGMVEGYEMRDPYAKIAEFYDREHDYLFQDIQMYVEYVVSAGDPVLELACGTGRIAIPIAEAGFRVMGADSSNAMLERAKARAAKSKAAQRLTLVQGDSRDADAIEGGPFGVVIMALDALSHIQTPEDQLHALTAARKALDPRGVLLLDVMHATPARLQAFDGSIGHDSFWSLPNGESIDRFSAHTVHPESQTISSRIWYDVTSTEGSVRRTATWMRQRYVSPGELLLMLEIAGFEDVMLYGDYQLEEFHDHSERLIVAAEATKTG